MQRGTTETLDPVILVHFEGEREREDLNPETKENACSWFIGPSCRRYKGSRNMKDWHNTTGSSRKRWSASRIQDQGRKWIYHRAPCTNGLQFRI